ncbi:MAG: hypothetical protein J0L64_06505 [Acidobacteria bacterium]|nr:hypothetical protein [Acidobacteriota bacterium]
MRRLLPVGFLETCLLCLRTEGWAVAFTRGYRLLMRPFSGDGQRHRPTPEIPRVLGLQPGERVEVRALEEIESTLDENGKLGGLAFTSEMRAYCGRRFRVFERLELLYNEYTHQHRTVKNTVLLQNVYCHGVGFGCHRRCFHFWREAWLKRAAEGAREESTGKEGS